MFKNKFQKIRSNTPLIKNNIKIRKIEPLVNMGFISYKLINIHEANLDKSPHKKRKMVHFWMDTIINDFGKCSEAGLTSKRSFGDIHTNFGFPCTWKENYGIIVVEWYLSNFNIFK